MSVVSLRKSPVGITPATFTPLPFEILPGVIASQTTSSPETSRTFTFTNPSAMAMMFPGLASKCMPAGFIDNISGEPVISALVSRISVSYTHLRAHET